MLFICSVFFCFSCIAQYKETLQPITPKQIIGSTTPIIIDKKRNYYQLNTNSGSTKMLLDWMVKSNQTEGIIYSGYEPFHNQSGNTVVQILKQNKVDKIVVTNIDQKKKRILKLSEKIDYPHVNTITENGSALFTSTEIVNLTTGKVIKLSFTNKKLIGLTNNLTNGVFWEGDWENRTYSILNIATGKLVQKINGTYTNAFCLNDWLVLQKTDAATGFKIIEAFNINTLQTIKFPLKIESSSISYSTLNNNCCYFEYTSPNSTINKILWDCSKNKTYDFKLIPEEYLKGNVYEMAIGSKNTIYNFFSKDSLYATISGLRQIDYSTGKIVQEWRWSKYYSYFYYPIYVKLSNLINLYKEEMYGNPFNNLSNYTNNASSYAVTISDNKMSEKRKGLYQTSLLSNDDQQIEVQYGNINKDNFKDLLIKNNKTEGVHILLNDGFNNFTKKITLLPTFSQYGLNKIFLKDINKDNVDEILLIEYSSDGELNKIGIFSTADVTKGFIYNEVKKDLFNEFMDHCKIDLESLPYYKTIGADFDNDGVIDKIMINQESVIIPNLPKQSVEIQKKIGNKEAKVNNSLCFTFHRTVHSIFIDDFDKDGNTDFLVTLKSDPGYPYKNWPHFRDYYSYIFFNKKNGEEFEVQRLQSGLMNIDTLDINNQLTYVGRSSKDLFAFTCTKDKQIKQDTIVSNIVRSNYNYNAFVDLNNDGYKELTNICYNPDLAEGYPNSIHITVYNPLKTNTKIEYAGLCIDERKEYIEKEEAKTRAAKAKAQEEYDRINPKKQTSTTSTGSGSKKETTSTATKEPEIDYSKLSKGLGVFSGVSSSGLRIEVEATVWYKTVQTKGMLGFKYKEVYKAECIRFRYPTNSKTWYSLSGSDCIYKCQNRSMTFSKCISIQGMEFAIGEPTIY